MKRVFLTFCFSFFALAAWADETALTAKNIQGEFNLKSGDGLVDTHLELATKVVRIKYTEEGSTIRCRGEYSFDESSLILNAKLYDCGTNKLNLNFIVYLSGQYLETLQNKTYTIGSITMGDDNEKTLPFSIEKIKIN